MRLHESPQDSKQEKSGYESAYLEAARLQVRRRIEEGQRLGEVVLVAVGVGVVVGRRGVAPIVAGPANAPALAERDPARERLGAGGGGVVDVGDVEVVQCEQACFVLAAVPLQRGEQEQRGRARALAGRGKLIGQARGAV